MRTISQLFQDALGLTAWKEYQDARWALRANPSSGNLHPTEGYLVSGPAAGLGANWAVYHYQPHDHVLEKRADIEHEDWSRLVRILPQGAFLVGLTSILWREAWKYGERAFRYCQHDVGHAIGSLAMAAAALGWRVRLLPTFTDTELARLLGIDAQQGVEAEHADCLLAVYPGGQVAAADPTSTGTTRWMENATWLGTPNQLSAEHHEWSIIEEVATATVRDRAQEQPWWGGADMDTPPVREDLEEARLRSIIHQRRSAVDMDGKSQLSRADFMATMLRLLPAAAIPFSSLDWPPAIDLVLFVHRVDGLRPDCTCCSGMQGVAPSWRGDGPGVRMGQTTGLPAPSTPVPVEVGRLPPVGSGYQLCQAIAADGAFAVAMLARFHATLEDSGPISTVGCTGSADSSDRCSTWKQRRWGSGLLASAASSTTRPTPCSG